MAVGSLRLMKAGGSASWWRTSKLISLDRLALTVGDVVLEEIPKLLKAWHYLHSPKDLARLKCLMYAGGADYHS